MAAVGGCGSPARGGRRRPPRRRRVTRSEVMRMGPIVRGRVVMRVMVLVLCGSDRSGMIMLGAFAGSASSSSSGSGSVSVMRSVIHSSTQMSASTATSPARVSAATARLSSVHGLDSRRRKCERSSSEEKSGGRVRLTCRPLANDFKQPSAVCACV